MINRAFFFSQIRKRLFTKVSPGQQLGLTAILDYWDNNLAAADVRWLAYALATAHHETDKTFGPIREYGRGRGKAYGAVYYGRGLVQLTWKANYEAMGRRLKVDLVKAPDLALSLEHAVPIMFIGMTEGRFTGRKFADYFNGAKADWLNARRIINGVDKRALIADYARAYHAAIRAAASGE